MALAIESRETEDCRSQEDLDKYFIRLNIRDLQGILNPMPPDSIEFYLSEREQSVIAGTIEDISKYDDLYEDYGIGMHIIARLNFLRRKCFDHLYQHEQQVIESRFISVNDCRKHIATAMYMSLLYRNYIIITGSIQYRNIGLLWQSLSNNYEQIKTDIVNVEKGIIVKHDHKVKDFNSDEVWQNGSLGLRHAFRLTEKR